VFSQLEIRILQSIFKAQPLHSGSAASPVWLIKT